MMVIGLILLLLFLALYMALVLLLAVLLVRRGMQPGARGHSAGIWLVSAMLGTMTLILVLSLL